MGCAEHQDSVTRQRTIGNRRRHADFNWTSVTHAILNSSRIPVLARSLSLHSDSILLLMDAINRTLRIMDEIAVMGMLAHLIETFKSSGTTFPRGLQTLLIIVVLALAWDIIALVMIAANDFSSAPPFAIADMTFFAITIAGVVLFAPWVLNERKTYCSSTGGWMEINVSWGSNCILPTALWSMAIAMVPSFLVSAVLDVIADE